MWPTMSGLAKLIIDHVEAAQGDLIRRALGDLSRAHRGLQVVGCDLGRRDQHALLEGERLLHAAIEEVGYVRVLLGLGDAKLVQSGFGHNLPERVVKLGGREQDAQEVAEPVRVFGHAERRREPDDGVAREAVEIRIDERSRDLADAVGAIVAEDHAVAVAHALVVAEHGRLHEFVADAERMVLEDGPDGIVRRLAPPLHHRVVDERRAFPAAVPVHGVVASSDGGHRAGPLRSQVILQVFQVAPAGSGRCVAAVGEGVDEDLGDAPPSRRAHQRFQVLDVAVDAAVGHQPHEVEAAARLLDLGQRIQQDLVPIQLAALDGLVDARQVLVNDTSCADIEVADLGIAELPARQAHVGRRRLEEAVGGAGDEAIPHRLAGLRNRIVFGLDPMAPAVEDTQDHKLWLAFVAHLPGNRLLMYGKTGVEIR